MIAFGFANPWMLAGLGLAAAPIVIHLLFRRPHLEIPWAATRLLARAMQRHSTRLRTERWLLLAVRTLILILATLGLARPFAAQPPGPLAGPEPAIHRVIVLDTSYSMAAPERGRPRFEVAMEMLREILATARPGDAFQVLQMSTLGRTNVVSRPSFEAAEVAKAIAKLRVSAGRAEPLPMLLAAAGMLRFAPEIERKELIVISDFQSSDWKNAETIEPISKLLADPGRRATVRLIDVTKSDESAEARPATDNFAVTELSSNEEFVRVGEPLRFSATVRHFGPQAASDVRVQLLVDDSVTATQTARPTAGGTARVIFTHAFGEPGPHRVEVRLEDDALVIDNRRFLTVTARDALRTLLVDGSSATGGRNAETFYFRRALAATAVGRASDFAPEVIAPSALLSADLATFDVVALVDVPVLTETEVRRLRAFINAGGGLMLTMGNRVRLDDYNRLLFAEDAWFPIRLESRVGDPSQPERAFQFDPTELTHPIVNLFRGNPGTGLDTDFVLAYARVVPVDVENQSVTVPLRFENGDPTIVVGELGAGRVLLLATSVGTAWAGPWPQLGRSYLPLVHEMTRWVAGGRAAAQATTVGQPIVWTSVAMSAQGNASLVLPTGETQPLPIENTRSGLRIAIPSPERPGFYTLELDGTIIPRVPLAVNVDAAEGDLASLSNAELDDLVAGSASSLPEASTQATQAESPLGRLCLLAALGLVLVEPVLAWRFRYGVVALGLFLAGFCVVIARL